MSATFIIAKAFVAGMIVALCSWLSIKKPELSGFITALPLVSIMALCFSYNQSQDLGSVAQYAKSIIFAVPISWLFFVPFFFVEKWQGSFWMAWGSGLLLLAAGYFLHQFIMKFAGGA